MEKVFKLTKGDFVVAYMDESQMGIYSGIKPISINFLPNAVMQPYEALEYANEFSDYIVKEAKIILAEQHEFYEGWELRFSNQFTATSASKQNVNSDLLATGMFKMNIYCKRIIQ